ncbi:MAG: hypothetical protein K0S74_1391 [Chlamydiales bacterium]|jgi:predicted  nucleic acid-binding Zn-ribbon protein|nr:hypothetical protein [Chlamydiales bacterium]
MTSLSTSATQRTPQEIEHTIQITSQYLNSIDQAITHYDNEIKLCSEKIQEVSTNIFNLKNNVLTEQDPPSLKERVSVLQKDLENCYKSMDTTNTKVIEISKYLTEGVPHPQGKIDLKLYAIVREEGSDEQKQAQHRLNTAYDSLKDLYQRSHHMMNKVAELDEELQKIV